MKTTMTLSTNLNCSPFEIFDQDIDEVIMLINFYILLGENKEADFIIKDGKKHQRIRVNDKTATGGWF